MEINLNRRLTSVRSYISYPGISHCLSNQYFHQIERACWIVGGSALIWCLLTYVDMALFQARGTQQFEAMQQTIATAPTAPTGTLIARIRIPRIGLSAVVVNGADDRTLSHAVGHIPGTASPGGAGTVGLAAHRDTFFRGLGRVRTNDEIFLETPSATYRYRVTDTAIVEPSDIKVLRPLKYPALVLVTCYPFGFVGRAPLRYIVTARGAAGEGDRKMRSPYRPTTAGGMNTAD